ncbi:hypothetical protein GN244_ATG08019 [Phytophthora infestans]|uniref:Uncharacterized protein n=1 Tax=Phytophthora infestans TaxID=4787 RepID=A0A833WF98_PHYIN|nr:hypothetical protein GN244_ATG08019 [Phytophthora infestans]
MQAAVITKDKHKKPVSGEVDVSLAAATPAVTAAHMAIAISTSKSLEIKAVVAVEVTSKGFIGRAYYGHLEG